MTIDNQLRHIDDFERRFRNRGTIEWATAGRVDPGVGRAGRAGSGALSNVATGATASGAATDAAIVSLDAQTDQDG